jgi:hypothetical protein
MFKTSRTLTYLAVALLVAACDDDDDIIVPPVNTVVATFVDSNMDFGDLQTFALPDTVVHLVAATGTPVAISREFDREILDRVRVNLLSRGYTIAEDPDSVTPDFLVLVGTTATQNYAAWVTYPWFTSWGFYRGLLWYEPRFDATWGIVYPWGGAVGVTAYQRGTIIVDLIPTLSVQPVSRMVQSAWAGAATGLLNQNVEVDDINDAIDEMFLLSPYMRSDAQPAGLVR